MDVDSPNGINMGIVGRLTYPHIRNDGEDRPKRCRLSINNGGFPLGVHEEIRGFPSFGRGCKFASEIGEHPFNM